ncbi:carbohydrate-binding module family 14 protein [Dickeya sp. DW 0440]|uniref:carbohydrate-binding module family 14 protein n=1 Tax=Dickeya sp. DW 0440 TaxID=1225785 RepID=UPI0034CE7817
MGLESLHLPHCENCSKFYMCAHGLEVEMECAPGGLVFVFEMQVCDWAWRAPASSVPKKDLATTARSQSSLKNSIMVLLVIERPFNSEN